MENNEIMNYDEVEVMTEVDKGTGMSTGAAMLVGAGITLAIGAGVKLVKRGIAAYKAKKAAREAEAEIDEEELVEVSE